MNMDCLGDTSKGAHAERARRWLGRSVYSFGPSKVKSLRALQIEALAAEFAAVRAEALEEACGQVCRACAHAMPGFVTSTGLYYHQGDTMASDDCRAAAIRALKEREP